MATIHDVMPVFELFQPTTIDDTLALLDKYKKDVWVLAGGLDSFDWLKDRNKRPKVVVDVSGVTALRGIKSTADGGLGIGAGTTLTEATRDPAAKEKLPIPMPAPRLVALPQIRNHGPNGSNVSQDTPS